MPTSIWQMAAKLLIISGVALVILGLVTLAIVRWGRGGQFLPGDIVISRPGFTLYLPVVS